MRVAGCLELLVLCWAGPGAAQKPAAEATVASAQAYAVEIRVFIRVAHLQALGHKVHDGNSGRVSAGHPRLLGPL